MERFVRKVKKYTEFFATKITLLVEQKTFKHEDVTYKYMLEENPSDTLVIVFSSCTRLGIKARYNYVRTLKPVVVNKLFILDDFAADHRGAFYIGTNMKFNEERACMALISKVIKDTKAKKIICCGSSKGGWSALNFGLQIDGSYIITGGPSYLLGNWLERTGNRDTYEHIVGDINPANKAILDSYLPNRVRNNPFGCNQKIYLHYSDKDWTYHEHIKFIIADMQTLGYQLEQDVAHYEEHGDISLYFPDYLKKSIEKIVSEE